MTGTLEEKRKLEPAEQRPLVLGTAGHIDHGKTALIGALTGIDTDRLPEEKARGITIDLGFAALELEGVGRLAVVDVPGHEGLVRTMVSGASGIDLVLLVVAADEGVMPQTREHVAICDLLGIEHGLVALSKIDLVDEEFIEIASAEVHDLLAPTRLAGSPIVPVSAHTGAGLDVLRTALREMARRARPRTPRSGPARLWVDRTFAIRGFGAVVTGTLVGEALRTGEAIELLPAGLHARVRGLQSHGEATATVTPGSRCAANLQGIDLSELHRGDLLCQPDRLWSTSTFDSVLWWLAGAPPVEETAEVEFLVGTAERRARLGPIGAHRFEPGGRLFVRVHIEGAPLALLPGDRFIVRGFARSENAGATLGGGAVLDVAPPHRRRSDPTLRRELEVFESGEPAAGLRERIDRAGLAGLSLDTLMKQTGIEPSRLEEQLRELEAAGELRTAGAQHWLGEAAALRMQASLLTAIHDFHRAEPLRPGMPRAALRGKLPANVPVEISERVLDDLEKSGALCREGKLVRHPEYQPTLTAEDERRVAHILETADTAALEPPNARDWAAELQIDLEHFRDLVAHLERQHELVRAPGDLWFAKAAIDTLCERVRRHFREHEELDTQTYKALIGTTRRTAMPLMELLDDLHVTRRLGDARVLRA